MVLLIKAREVRAQMPYCFMRNLRAIFAFMCLMSLIITVATALGGQPDPRNVRVFFHGSAVAAMCAAVVIYANQRLRGKIQS